MDFRICLPDFVLYNLSEPIINCLIHRLFIIIYLLSKIYLTFFVRMIGIVDKGFNSIFLIENVKSIWNKCRIGPSVFYLVGKRRRKLSYGNYWTIRVNIFIGNISPTMFLTFQARAQVILMFVYWINLLKKLSII